jgi:hypothetical protein
MIPVLAREFEIDARGFSATSHVQSLLYGHAAHALSLNDICDALAVHEAEFMRVRGATPPARNTFSNANRTRDPALAEALYWRMLAHLQDICPGFTEYGKHAGFIFRLGPQLLALRGHCAQRLVGQDRPRRPSALLWDSRWPAPPCTFRERAVLCRRRREHVGVWPV